MPSPNSVSPAVPTDDDGLDSKFRLVALSALRARQLQLGARPRVEPADHKPARVAVLEVRAGMVSWDLADAPLPRPAPPQDRGHAGIE